MAIVVSSAAELTAVLGSVQGGETIVLAPGDYGDLQVQNLHFSSMVTICSMKALDNAVFSSITISNSSNLAFSNVIVEATPDSTTYAFSSAISIRNSSSISVVSSDIRGGLAVNGVDPSATVLDKTGNVLGQPAGRAFTVLDSSDITIGGNNIETFHKGIVVSNVDGLTLMRNEVHGLRTTPISGSGVRNAVIESNYLHDSLPWNFGGTGDHGDFIHFWTVPSSQGLASENIAIRNNVLDQGAGTALLGIYLDDNGKGLGFLNVAIESNLIVNNSAQAIRLENVQGVVAANMLVQSFATNYHDYPGILALTGSAVTLTGNVVSRITVDATSAVTESDNLATINGILDSANPLLVPITSGMKVFAPLAQAGAIEQTQQQIADRFDAATDIALVGHRIYVFGTKGADDVQLISGKIQLDANFAIGGDTIRVDGDAADFKVSRSGTDIVLDGAKLDVIIPVGTDPATVVFTDGERYQLAYDPRTDIIGLSSYSIGIEPVALTSFG